MRVEKARTDLHPYVSRVVRILNLPINSNSSYRNYTIKHITITHPHRYRDETVEDLAIFIEFCSVSMEEQDWFEHSPNLLVNACS